MSVLIIIPARLASTRLPDKPLADIAGLPMVVCVARAAEAAGYGTPVIAAADDAIVQAARAHGATAVLTDSDLPSGSDRVWAATQMLDPEHNVDIVVNVQGDMPELHSMHVEAVIEALRDDASADIATLAFQSEDLGERADENVVKVIMKDTALSRPSQAISFTRHGADLSAGAFWHHIGIYAFSRTALEKFCALPPSPRENAEKLEQWRALDAGMKIVCAPVLQDCPGIDSPADLARIRRLRNQGQHS